MTDPIYRNHQVLPPHQQPAYLDALSSSYAVARDNYPIRGNAA